MSNAHVSLIALAMVLVNSAPVAAQSGQYITTEQQRELAKQHLEQRQKEREQQQQQDRSNNSVDKSTDSYGKQWLEQQLQGDKPRVNRTW